MVYNITGYLIALFFCPVFITFHGGKASTNQNITSLIFVIHEDGFYDYFDGNVRKNAGKEAVNKAKQLAKKITQGEVFIFRQKPIAKNCICFTNRAETAYYYYKGQLINKRKYYREESHADFEIEAKFYELNSQTVINPDENHMHIFYYFGQTIPELMVPGYSLSMGKSIFSSEEYQAGLKRFTKLFEKNFDAVILASSFGGTPGMVAKSLDSSDYLVASPSLLSNVSYDIGKLATMDMQPKTELSQLLKGFIKSSFSILKDKSLAEVSVSLYSKAELDPVLQDMATWYQLQLNEFNSRTYANRTYIDCTELVNPEKSNPEDFSFHEQQDLVYTLFRKAYRGWGYQKNTNSGWVCPQVKKIE